MPSLIDIPEELSHYSAYGSNQRLSHIAEELRRSGSFNNPPFATVDETDNNGRSTSYGTLKRPAKKSDSLQRNSLGRKTATEDGTNKDVVILENKDEIYHPMELRANFLQKSPLPGRKLNGIPETTLNHASIYTNPSIEEIYRSLDRSQQQQSQQQPTLRSKMSIESGAESDAVSDLVSEAESKMPKITGAGMNRPNKTYYEPDSLDRKPGQHHYSGNVVTTSSNNRPHLYQKKPPRWSKRAQHQQHQQQQQHPDTNDEMREADEQSSSAAGYNSSTCTSIQSLSRVLPAEEAMEVGNQLFNMDTGAPTLPRLIKSAGGLRTGHIYETIGHQRDKNGMFVNKEFRKPNEVGYEATTSSSSSSSKVTVVEDCLKNTKLTIQVEDIQPSRDEEAFEPDTLERRNDSMPFRRQESFIADSLERPIQPVKSTINKLLNSCNNSSSSSQTSASPVSPSSSSGLGSSGESVMNKEDWIKKEELPPPGSVVSLRQIYNARSRSETCTTKLGAWTTTTLEASKAPVTRIVSASNPQVLLRLSGIDPESTRTFQSLPVDSTLAASSPPPLPVKSVGSPSSLAPLIPRDLKPPIGVHQHPPLMKTGPPLNSRGVQTDSTPPPTLPPKNAKGGSSGRADAATSATSADQGLGDDKIYSGHFILSHPSPSGTIKLPNVLERIAQIEREESRISGASKGMEIAMSLKARMGHLEGSLKDHKKTLSIKRTWRKLLDKVEDSFSETESAGSTLRRASASTTSKLLKKSLPPPPPSDEEDVTDDDSSLGSDGTGRDRHSIAGGNTTTPASTTNTDGQDGVKLKSFYTFGDDRLPSPVLHQPLTSPIHKSISAGRRSAVASPAANNPVSNNLIRNKSRPNESYDSGLYSSHYSTYIGDY